MQQARPCPSLRPRRCPRRRARGGGPYRRLILTLADDNVGVLPQCAVKSLAELMRVLDRRGWDGFSTRYWMPADVDSARLGRYLAGLIQGASYLARSPAGPRAIRDYVRVGLQVLG